MPRFRVIFPFFMLLGYTLSWAQEEDTLPPTLSAPQTLEQAEAWRLHADAMRKGAERRRAEEETACYRKILVNACLEEARERHTETIIKARRIETLAREFQRVARRGDVEAGKDRREAERPAHEIEQRERAEHYRGNETAKAGEREKKRIAKERRAEANREKQVKAQARREREAEKRAEKQAKQIEKKARKRARAEEKTARKNAN